MAVKDVVEMEPEAYHTEANRAKATMEYVKKRRKKGKYNDANISKKVWRRLDRKTVIYADSVDKLDQMECKLKDK